MGRTNGFSRVPFFEIDERTERVLKKKRPLQAAGFSSLLRTKLN
jgi:hypothetical protein